MIIPSIDFSGGRVVQLIEGETPALEIENPQSLAREFGLVGEIAVIDIDRARGTGQHESEILALLPLANCRVGGGIRDYETAARFLDAGATSIIIGTSATPEFLTQLPRERLIVALDARNGKVVVEGWRAHTGMRVEDRIRELAPYVGGFLVTLVEREGHMEGTDLKLAGELKKLCGHCSLTIAGGVTSEEEVAELDQLGIDAQVGMALYTGRLGLADALAAMLSSDRSDGLWPTVIVDEHGTALGLAYSNLESLRGSLRLRSGIYHSRKRGLWQKGATSGAYQELLSVRLDCDRDTLCFVVRQHEPGFCHLNQHSCFGDRFSLSALERLLRERRKTAPVESYTARLFGDSKLLESKIVEEAHELVAAKSSDAVAEEAADVLFFTLCKLVVEGASLEQVETILDARNRRISRRPGNAKPINIDSTEA